MTVSMWGLALAKVSVPRGATQTVMCQVGWAFLRALMVGVCMRRLPMPERERKRTFLLTVDVVGIWGQFRIIVLFTLLYMEAMGHERFEGSTA